MSFDFRIFVGPISTERFYQNDLVLTNLKGGPVYHAKFDEEPEILPLSKETMRSFALSTGNVSELIN